MPPFNHQMLRQIRLDLGLSQEQAATSLGIDVRTFRRYESGAINGGRGFSVRHPARRQLLRRLCEEFGIDREEDWLLADEAAASSPPVAWAPRHVHPLPRARHFTRRASLLQQLGAWEGDPDAPHRVVVLVGVGGAGKTSLAERHLAAHAAGQGGRLVFSFYEESSVDRFLAEALAYFGGPSGPLGSGGRLEALLSALGSGPRHLLVLDGLEAVQSEGGGGRALGELEDPLLRRLLRAIAGGLGRARALCTSRLPLTDLAPWEGQTVQTLPVTDLAEAEARTVLRAWGVRGEDSALRLIVEQVGQHALSVAMTASYLGGFLGGDPTHLGAIPLDAAAQDDPLARRLAAVLSAYGRGLAEPERDLLCRLAALPRGGDLDLLRALCDGGKEVAGSLCGLGEAELLRLLRRLEQLGLVSSAGTGSYTIHPFVREHFRGLLGAEAGPLHELAGRRVEAQLRGRPAGHPRDPAVLELHEALLEHTLLAGRPLAAAALYELGLGGFAHLGLRLGEMARGARLVRHFCRQGTPEQSDERLPVEVRARLVYDLGLYTSALGDLARAERCYQAYLRLVEETAVAGASRAGAGRAMGLRTLAYNTWLRGDLAAASDLLEEAIAASRGEPAHLLRAVALHGAVLHDRGDVEGADRSFAQMHDLEGGPPEARRALWEAEHHLGLGRIQQAEAGAGHSQVACEGRGWAGLVAHGRTVLGRCALARGEWEAAREHERAARGWSQVSGEVEMRLRVHVLAARLALATGEPAQAITEAAAGSEAARLYGFRLLAVQLGELVAEGELAQGRADRAVQVAGAAHSEALACGYAPGVGAVERLLARVRGGQGGP